MNVEVFRTLLLVDEHRNYRVVADAMNLSQPAIAKRIRVFEEALGVELVTRRGREIVLTRHGRAVLPYAERIARIHEEMRASVADLGEGVGTIRLGVVDTILYTWLPEFLDLHRRRHPNLEFEVSSSPTVDLVEDLRALRIDMAIMLGPSADRPFVDVPLGEMEVGFFAHPRPIGEAGRPDADAISRMKIVTFPRGSRPFVDLLNGIRSLSLPRAPRVTSSSSVLTMRNMAERGIAVATLPVELARGAELERLDIGLSLPNLSFSATFNPLSADRDLERSCRTAAEVAARTGMGRIGRAPRDRPS